MNEPKVTPYRLNQLMKVASKVTDQMISSIWNLTYDEMDIILELIRCGIIRSRETNMAGSGLEPDQKGE